MKFFMPMFLGVVAGTCAMALAQDSSTNPFDNGGEVIPIPEVDPDGNPLDPVTRPDQIVGITFHESGVGRMGFSIQRANGDEDVDPLCGTTQLVEALNADPEIGRRAAVALEACELSIPCEEQVRRLRKELSDLQGDYIRLKTQLNLLEGK